MERVGAEVKLGCSGRCSGKIPSHDNHSEGDLHMDQEEKMYPVEKHQKHTSDCQIM